jgi:hypothetical protein
VVKEKLCPQHFARYEQQKEVSEYANKSSARIRFNPWPHRHKPAPGAGLFDRSRSQLNGLPDS